MKSWRSLQLISNWVHIRVNAKNFYYYILHSLVKAGASSFSSVTAPVGSPSIPLTLSRGVYEYYLTAYNSNDNSFAYLGGPGFYSKSLPCAVNTVDDRKREVSFVNHVSCLYNCTTD